MVDLTELLGDLAAEIPIEQCPQLDGVNKIGEGKWGRVYRCALRDQDPDDETVYVAKNLAFSKQRPDERKSMEQTFRREVEALWSIKCDRIVQLKGVYSNQNDAGMILECAQISLGQLLHSKEHGGLSYHLGHAIQWMLHAAEALRYLHSRNPPIIHRDIKSDNCLLFDDCLSLKLADFGLAREDDDINKTNAMGTPVWMAPECSTGNRYGPEVDIYGWGIMLWECVTRMYPFYNCRYTSDAKGNYMNIILRKVEKRETPAKITGIPDVLWNVMQKCFAFEPKERLKAPIIVKYMQEFTKFVWEPKRIAVLEDRYEPSFEKESEDNFDTNMSRVTAYQPSKDAKTITEFHPAFNDMLEVDPPKKRKEHVRSRSAEPNLLQEIQQEENFNRSKSFYLKQHSRRSDYSSLNAPPSLGESIDRRIGSQSSVVSHGTVFGMDSGYSGARISVVAADDFQPGCFPKLPNRRSISSYWTSNNKRQLQRELPGHEPLCHFSVKLNREGKIPIFF